MIIRAKPATDFNGVVLVNSLEIGAVLIGSQRVPTVRFAIKQSGHKYKLLARGRQSGEVYAYALAAIGKGWEGLEAHIVAYPRPTLESGIVFIVAADEGGGITWHSGSELRATAVQLLVDILNGVAPTPPWPVTETPFLRLESDN